MDKSIAYIKKLLQSWWESVLAYLPDIFLAIVILILFFLLAKIARRITLKFYSETIKVHPDIASIIASVINFFLILSGVFLALQVLGLESVLTKLLAGAGIIGIVAGFAFKDIASNIFAGLLLKMHQPFKKGDWVNINNSYGVVEELFSNRVFLMVMI